MAMAGWAWADNSGYAKRKEMDKMEKRKQNRIEKQRKQLGILPTKVKK
jgi:small Trp-rich protein